MTSNASIKLYFIGVGNNEFILLCNFASRNISGLKVIEGGLHSLPSNFRGGRVNHLLSTSYLTYRTVL